MHDVIFFPDTAAILILMSIWDAQGEQNQYGCLIVKKVYYLRSKLVHKQLDNQLFELEMQKICHNNRGVTK